MSYGSILPEWSPHKALWVGWPYLREEWGDDFDGARGEIAEFVKAASQYIPVKVACGSHEAFVSASDHLRDAIDAERFNLVRVPTGDIWLRDTGPIVGTGDSAPIALTFGFNGWGGKYKMPGDTETAAAIANAEESHVRTFDFILEGGAIDIDGAGRLMTTRECLLNPNRNGWSKDEAERALKHAFKVEEIIWLDGGLMNDHTDGHIDNVARFVGPSKVVCQSGAGADDPNAELYESVAASLEHAGLTVIRLPSPGRMINAEGDIIPASHMNFVITNGAVILPVYEERNSAEAARILGNVFPDRKVLCLPARHILGGGGSFHCMTREIPAIDQAT